ncbi:MAG TPA: type II CAAX endopeptidase family protein [Rhabdochlamydiaceae bacterium]
MIADSIYIILVFGLIGLITNTIAWRKGFYNWRYYPAPPISFRHVGFLFAIYIGVTYVLATYFGALLQKYSQTAPTTGLIVFLQFVLIAFMLIGFYVYCHTQAKGVFIRIWKNPAVQPPTSPLYDFLFGAVAWLVAFPVVQVVGQLFDMILFVIFRFEGYEQVAVKYLKTTLESPAMAVLALISIVIIAPVVEEFLFRGALQTYLKRRLPPKTAIMVASACFGLFHFSPEQGFGNISLIVSLFVFGSFLGYVYEKQGSLYASIGLHMAFNFVSSVRILFG